MVIRYIEHPSERVKFEAATQNGLSIQFMNDPNEKTQLAAIRQNMDAIELIKNPLMSVVSEYNAMKMRL